MLGNDMQVAAGVVGVTAALFYDCIVSGFGLFMHMDSAWCRPQPDGSVPYQGLVLFTLHTIAR